MSRVNIKLKALIDKIIDYEYNKTTKVSTKMPQKQHEPRFVLKEWNTDILQVGRVTTYDIVGQRDYEKFFQQF
ncbi:hypothetical protein [Urbanus proteus nucleopolyhedrovirus]|uniref:Uncharacterized protein n=1 Tax=Urbanus proteus nucleopolyhedrovirus TaxID=1675866 RepID=A0A162GTV8_9ABAC|nr:hypothetical protein [Urbanus proteus nucleopolyhedrovirus]AKR17298.1 hypothetical protein [Urbanus proteus nucleopolyhedrovirus]